MNITEKLNKLQKELGKTGKDMSKLLDVNTSFYSMVKNGSRKPSSKVLKKLVEISGEPISYWDGTLDRYLESHRSGMHLGKLIDSLVDGGFINEPDDIFKEDFEIILKKTIKLDVAAKLTSKKYKGQQ